VPIVSDISKDCSASIFMVKQSKKSDFYMSYHANYSIPVSSQRLIKMAVPMLKANGFKITIKMILNRSLEERVFIFLIAL
jgi:hypothetical protein